METGAPFPTLARGANAPTIEALISVDALTRWEEARIRSRSAVIPGPALILWTDAVERRPSPEPCGEARIPPTGQGRWAVPHQSPVDRGDCGDKCRTGAAAVLRKPLRRLGIPRLPDVRFRGALTPEGRGAAGDMLCPSLDDANPAPQQTQKTQDS